MITFERKKINNKPFYYLTEQIRIGNKFKKIQVFVGKNIPKDISGVFDKLKQKEKGLVKEQITSCNFPSKYIDKRIISNIESSRIDWKYHKTKLSVSKLDNFLRDFAIKFIFESNAIEGSRLSEDEVSAIVKKQYVKKNIPRIEIIEVGNSIEAFKYMDTNYFKLNQKNIKKLQEIIVKDLDIPIGFKKQDIIVNNKKTVTPKKVRSELTKLIDWYSQIKKTEHPIVRATIFHNKFEHIHPFTNGNGRVGRLIFNWMLMQEGYGVILFKNRNKIAYMNALDNGDNGRYRNILNLSIKTYRNTIRDLLH